MDLVGFRLKKSQPGGYVSNVSSVVKTFAMLFMSVMDVYHNQSCGDNLSITLALRIFGSTNYNMHTSHSSGVSSGVHKQLFP